MRRETDEAYAWAASQAEDSGLIPEVAPWAEGRTVELREEVAKLAAVVADTRRRVENLETPGKGRDR